MGGPIQERIDRGDNAIVGVIDRRAHVAQRVGRADLAARRVIVSAEGDRGAARAIHAG